MTIADGFLFNLGKLLADACVYVFIAALLFVLTMIDGRND